jgi:hypothetical protein
MSHKNQTVPSIYPRAAHDWTWAWADGVVVDRVISLSVLVLSPNWLSLLLLYHISHWVQWLSETEAPPPCWDFCIGASFTNWSVWTSALSSSVVLLNLMSWLVSNLCSTLVISLAGPGLCASYAPYAWSTWFYPSPQHTLCHTNKEYNTYRITGFLEFFHHPKTQ